MTAKVNLFYIYCCDELIGYLFQGSLEEEHQELLKRLIDIRYQFRFYPLSDSMLREFWRCHDATYHL